MNHQDLKYLMAYGQWLLDKHNQEAPPDVRKSTKYFKAVQTLIDFFVEQEIIITPFTGSTMLCDNTPFHDNRDILYRIATSDDENFTVYYGPKEQTFEKAIQSWNKEVHNAKIRR